ncbi:helix-turn-helix domain-containing protein [Spirulina subsalsa]|uniref:helix-turn-helix domain-containing protein n=1 Tax=Spirulina subsalsa TaxID=54311 RepID=UPI000303E2FD|nr:helix-turn-helix transcriptional regulator [Spirulina subsalsa]
MNKLILIQFGEKVRAKRLEQGLSQEELAEKANVHRTYIGMVERAEKNITLLNIAKIANALNISIAHLFSHSELAEDWAEELIRICHKYNIEVTNLPAILQDPKVLPMIRGKSFEFSTLAQFLDFLAGTQWQVNKLVLNPQFGHLDEDITMTHLPTKTKITIECKLAAKGRYRVVRENNKRYFQIDVKCMRSRTLGEKKVTVLAPKLGVSEDSLKIHNDQYRQTDFDIVVTSIANAFYVTDSNTGLYEWQPKTSATEFFNILFSANELNIEQAEIQRNLAFQQIYIARSQDITTCANNGIVCTRRKCQNPYNCGFIPNYPIISFDLATGNVLPPWFKLSDCLPLLESFL